MTHHKAIRPVVVLFSAVLLVAGCSSARLSKLDNGAVFADGGQTIIYHSYSSGEGEIVELNLKNKKRTVISEGASRHDRWPSVSADGSLIAFISYSKSEVWNAYLVSRTGENLRLISDPERDHLGVAVSPDGSAIAMARRTTASSDGRIDLVLLGLDSGQETLLAQGALWPHWAADEFIYFMHMKADGQGMVPARISPNGGKIEELADPALKLSGGGISPDGKFLYVSAPADDASGALSLHRLDLSTGELEDLGHPSNMDSAPKVSPDGNAVVFGYGAGASDGDIYLLDLRTGKLTNLTQTR